MRRLGRHAESADYARRAYDQYLETLGPEHTKVSESASRLAEVYRAWHEADPDAGHDSEAANWESLSPDDDST